MKNKMFSITDKQFEWLSNENASKLIRDLLDAHINAKKPRTKEEIDKEIKRLEAKAKYESKLKEINGRHNK